VPWYRTGGAGVDLRSRPPELQLVGLQDARGAQCFEQVVADVEPGLDHGQGALAEPGGAAAKNSKNATASSPAP
jgi:hypothetical protein